MIRLGAIMAKNFVYLAAIGLLFSGNPALAQQVQSKRPIVAVMDITDLSNTGQVEALSSMIQTAIEATNKFRVTDRAKMDKFLREQGLAKNGLVTSRTPGKIGGFEGADFLITGSINAYSVVTKSDLGASFLAGMMSNQAQGQTCRGAEATLSVDIKISEADTAITRYVQRLNEKQRVQTVCGGGVGQVDASALLRSAADKIANGLVTTVYPIQIAAVQADGVFVLNYGEGTMKVGDLMTVFVKGEEIRDPVTNEVLSNDETLIGAIRVSDVLGRISKADAYTPFETAPARGSIVRLATESDKVKIEKMRRRK
ncbi:MAG: hypothetical protein RLY97_968 [Pseudomonadota bacterium]|jgi:curli biogenesis system outer membrane secretion channel CsgG